MAGGTPANPAALAGCKTGQSRSLISSQG